MISTLRKHVICMQTNLQTTRLTSDSQCCIKSCSQFLISLSLRKKINLLKGQVIPEVSPCIWKPWRNWHMLSLWHCGFLTLTGYSRQVWPLLFMRCQNNDRLKSLVRLNVSFCFFFSFKKSIIFFRRHMLIKCRALTFIDADLNPIIHHTHCFS